MFSRWDSQHRSLRLGWAYVPEEAKRLLVPRPDFGRPGPNVPMIGPPGSGKSMIAKPIPSILSPLTLAEAIETTKIHGVCGRG